MNELMKEHEETYIRQPKTVVRCAFYTDSATERQMRIRDLPDFAVKAINAALDRQYRAEECMVQVYASKHKDPIFIESGKPFILRSASDYAFTIIFKKGEGLQIRRRYVTPGSKMILAKCKMHQEVSV